MLTESAPATSGEIPAPDREPSGPCIGCVVVVARLRLMSDVVGVALRGQDLPAVVTSWEDAVRRLPGVLGDHGVVVVLDDLASRQDVAAARDLIVRTDGRGVVLTAARSRHLWGAMLDSGAAGLLPAHCSLDAVTQVVLRVARREPVIGEAERTALVEEWRTWVQEDERLRGQLASLSARERRTLAMLADGYRINEIARERGITEAAVRSQVASLRRKLEVRSLLPAVVLHHRLGRDVPEPGSPGSPGRPSPS